ncbi:maleylpyruvate isomerase N-terminal domain-containing protein [Streptomyces sp. NPDC055722]
MGLWDLSPVDVRSLLRQERAELLALLNGLDPSAWNRPTVCPGWSVKDAALHILDDDLGWLSRGRDGDRSGLLTDFTDHESFIAALNGKNQRWVETTRVLSPRVISTLLEVAGTEMDAYTATCSHFLIGGRVVVGCRAAKRGKPRDGSHLIATPDTPGRPNPTNGSINPIKKVEPT